MIRLACTIIFLLLQGRANAFLPVAQQTAFFSTRQSPSESIATYDSSITTELFRRTISLHSDPPAKSGSDTVNGKNNGSSKTAMLRKRVGSLARNIVVRPISTAYSMPKAVAEVLKDATINAVDLAVEEVFRNDGSKNISSPIQEEIELDINGIVDEAFAPMEQSLDEMERSLNEARKSLELAKTYAHDAMEAIQVAASAQAEAAVSAVSRAEEMAERVALADFYAAANNVNTTEMSLEDIDFATSEMAPPFLDDDQCLIPGEPVVRVEKAPENSRRIFAGIDVMASVDTVWDLLTDYENLDKVVPNLLVNNVLETYDGMYEELWRSTKCEWILSLMMSLSSCCIFSHATLLIFKGLAATNVEWDKSLPDVEQCKLIASQMKGSRLHQVGGAKVVGINFSARTTLEVREWPQGLPDFAHFQDELWEGKSRKQRARDNTSVRLQRYKFPRPFAVSKLPTHDITMQSVEDDDGEFRMYQGVWRMQPLFGCAPAGQDAMRLTYAVEGTRNIVNI